MTIDDVNNKVNVLIDDVNRERIAVLSECLSSVDWTLAGRGKFSGVHDFHWYPARFIPQIPAYLVNELTVKGDLILDPFCGTGSTQVESLRLMRRSIGVDIHPLAVLISKAKYTFFAKNTFTRLHDILHLKLSLYLSSFGKLDISGEKEIWQGNKLDVSGEKEIWQDHRFLSIASSLSVPDIFLTDRWYHPRTLLELASIKKAIYEMPDPETKEVREFMDLCLVAFFSILKKCSSQKEHMSYVADNMIPTILKYEPAPQYFWKQIAKYILALNQLEFELQQAFGDIPNTRELAQTIVGDAKDLHFIQDGQIDCIITSPPYQGAIDTTTAHRLTAYWLNFDLLSLKQSEIGARWRRSRKNAFDEYSADLTLVFKEMKRVLKRGGTLALILGRPSARRKPLEISSLVDKLLVHDLGFIEVCQPIVRQTMPERKSVKSIKEDIIIVFLKD